jgi:chloride channel protein, CIC family
MERLPVSAVLRAAVVGGVAGLLAGLAPIVVGPGDPLTEAVVEGRLALPALAVLFLLRFALGPPSIAAGTPGGFFTPALALGALAGALVAVPISGLPGLEVSSTSMAIAGMGAALTVATQAPFTGVLLTIESTGAFHLLLPTTVACFAAAFVTSALRTPSMEQELGKRFNAHRGGPKTLATSPREEAE